MRSYDRSDCCSIGVSWVEYYDESEYCMMLL